MIERIKLRRRVINGFNILDHYSEFTLDWQTLVVNKSLDPLLTRIENLEGDPSCKITSVEGF